jgi:beta-glucosidase
MISRDFAYFNSKAHDWAIKLGKFDILIGCSSRDLPLKQTLTIESTNTAKIVLTRESLFKEFKK